MTRLQRVLAWTALVALAMAMVATSAHAVGLADLTPAVPRSQCCCCVIPIAFTLPIALGVARRTRRPAE